MHRSPAPEPLGRAVDAAVGADSDRAFTLLDKLAVWDRRGCACRTCRIGDQNLRLVLSAELDRLRRRAEEPGTDPSPDG